ncbi:MAG: hypothetical protein JWP29_948 [Rhodoferax sp.]|jgi:hypothetical protein|nr:hypothetical protein [Rhodoferax sp.]
MTNTVESRVEALQQRFAQQVSARLSDGAADLPYDISERLRAARAQAVAKRKVTVLRTASSTSVQGGTATLSMGDEETGWLNRLASVLPLLALVAGLLVIQFVQDDARVKELAEVDAALLTDDLPTAAYTDPGFVEFLKAGFESSQKQ